MSANTSSTVLRPAAAGAYIGGISASTLAKWRLYGCGPRYVKTGRLVCYPVHELDAWMAKNTRTSTSDKVA